MLSSNILNSKNKNFDENVAEINSRINLKKIKEFNADLMGNPNKNINRNFSGTDRDLIITVHSEWEKSDLDWRDP